MWKLALHCQGRTESSSRRQCHWCANGCGAAPTRAGTRSHPTSEWPHSIPARQPTISSPCTASPTHIQGHSISSWLPPQCPRGDEVRQAPSKGLRSPPQPHVEVPVGQQVAVQQPAPGTRSTSQPNSSTADECELRIGVAAHGQSGAVCHTQQPWKNDLKRPDFYL